MIAPIENTLPIELPPRAAEAVGLPPYWGLWQGMIDIALKRITWLREFAATWDASRLARDYEQRRAWCRFHLEWLCTDEPGLRFSFRELCEFSTNEDLSDAETVRARVLSWFSAEALQDVHRFIAPQVMHSIALNWKSQDCRMMVDRSNCKGNFTRTSRGDRQK